MVYLINYKMKIRTLYFLYKLNVEKDVYTIECTTLLLIAKLFPLNNFI